MENKNREEHIAELKKKYGELINPEEFDDDIYIKLEESEEAIKNGRVYTIEEFEKEMEKFFEELESNFKNNKVVIAEKKERYNINEKI